MAASFTADNLAARLDLALHLLEIPLDAIHSDRERINHTFSVL